MEHVEEDETIEVEQDTSQNIIKEQEEPELELEQEREEKEETENEGGEREREEKEESEKDCSENEGGEQERENEKEEQEREEKEETGNEGGEREREEREENEKESSEIESEQENEESEKIELEREEKEESGKVSSEQDSVQEIVKANLDEGEEQEKPEREVNKIETETKKAGLDEEGEGEEKEEHEKEDNEIKTETEEEEELNDTPIQEVGITVPEEELNDTPIQEVGITVPEEELNDTPIEEVRITVPVDDNPMEPALTFRTWVLGLMSCCILAFVNQFFNYRQKQVYVGSLVVQIVVLPIGMLMARFLPKRVIVPFTKWSFALNPGPFGKKEHVLVTIFAGCGASDLYSAHVSTIAKAFYHISINPIAAIVLALSSQLIGYGWTGLFRKQLVDSPYMWWPSNLVQVSIFRTLHEKENRVEGGFSRIQFFLIFFFCSFFYYILPGFLMPSVSSLSVICLIWSKSVIAQQIGSANSGMGLASFTLDWATVSGFLGSPLVAPLSTILNTFVGFFLILYVLSPLGYYKNFFEAKKFPFFSSHTFDYSGQTYKVREVLDADNYRFDSKYYNIYSKPYVSIVVAFANGFSFAALTSTITHVVLHHGRTILQSWRKTTAPSNNQFSDVHTRKMKKNYRDTPNSWFLTVLGLALALALIACEGFSNQLQLRWWGLVLACGISFIFTLPFGIILATTNMQPGINVITQMIIGYILPGKPLANAMFKTYAYISMKQSLTFYQNLKLGHYMKIPPRLMFMVQLVGTVIATLVSHGTSWWILTNVKHICDQDQLPKGSPWTCPGDTVFYNASIIWGVVGPLRMFTSRGIYAHLYWFFLVGLIAPIPAWFFSRKYPEKTLIKLINMPIIFGVATNLPPAKAVNFLYWGFVGILFNFYVYRWHKNWWARYTYILSTALDAGVAFMALILYFLRAKVSAPQWWGGGDDHCPIVHCPKAPGIQVTGCPVH